MGVSTSQIILLVAALLIPCIVLFVVLAAVLLLIAAGVLAVVLVAEGVFSIIVSFWLIFTTPLDGIATLGAGLAEVVIGIWLSIVLAALCRVLFRMMRRLLGRVEKERKKHKKRKFRVISLSCFGIGLVIMAGGMALGGRPGFGIDEDGISSASDMGKYRSFLFDNEKEKFTEVEIYVEDAHIEVIPSDRYAVEYFLDGRPEEPVCKAEDGKLILKESDQSTYCTGAFYLTGWDRDEYYVKVYVPAKNRLTKVSLESEYGDITAGALTCDTLEVNCRYGNTELDGVEGSVVKIHMESGELMSGDNNVERTEIYSESGNVQIRDMTGQQLSVEMEYGDLTANNLNVNSVNVKNEGGNVRLAMTEVQAEYNLDLVSEYGLIYRKQWPIPEILEDKVEYQTDRESGRRIEVYCESGDIRIGFASEFILCR